MDLNTKHIIRERTESLFPIIRDHINNQYEINSALGECFKFLYLCNLGPKKFLQEFQLGDLRINLSDVRDVYFDYAQYIPGKYGLQDFEEEIINRHNKEVERWLQKENRVIPYRQSSIGLVRHYL